MNIRVGQDYSVTSDLLNYVLLERTQSDPTHHFSKGDAKESWRTVGYYGNINYLFQTLEQLAKDKLDMVLLKNLLNTIENLKSKLVSELTPILNESFEIVEINKDYQVKKDSLNLILFMRKESDPNHHFSKGIAKETYKVAGYFGKIEHLVNSLIEQIIKGLVVTTFEQLLESVETLSEQLTIISTPIQVPQNKE